jgi:glycosyltransferase involved in cell wall biosynthesis
LLKSSQQGSPSKTDEFMRIRYRKPISKMVLKRMKVCIITSVHPPLDSRILHREAASLANNGFEVTLLVRSTDGDSTVGGVKIKCLRRRRSRFLRMASQWRFLLLALREKAELYHFHDPELIPILILVRILARRPVVYDVHEDYPDSMRLKEWVPRLVRGILAKLADPMERLSARCLSAVITADDIVARRFKNVRGPVVVLYNFPKRDFHLAGGSSKRSRGHPVQLIYTGSMSRERGQWLMLDVVRALVSQEGVDAGLWLAGEFDSERKRLEFIRAIEADDCLRGRVSWLGVLAHEEVSNWLGSADIGLVPLQPVSKFYKNIPTKLFEYMAMGLPIVGSDLPPIRKFVEESKTGCLAVPDKPESHVGKVMFLIQNPDLRRQMGENGRRAFETTYNWLSEEKKLLRLYSHLLESKKVDGI